ncbi:MAG: hydrogenase maturation protease [Ignavibacteria bacterium]|jgi:hydrogenase maturation protease|nr:hydrogenase maturation protease [Ignavibacteria bacterium]MDH7527838.1 hydrogenase maturation protease [Ignavibacteria bacterium]
MRQKIIGIGNEFRSDDAVGLIVARKLKELYPDFDIIESDGNGTDLLNYFQNYDKLIIIDAAISENPEDIGRIKEIKVTDDLDFSEINLFSSHAFSLLSALRLAKQLNILPKELYLYLIFSNNFSFGQEISQKVKESSEKILDIILKKHF